MEEAILKGELIGVYPISTIVNEALIPIIWIFSIDGPVGSCYEDGVFGVEFTFPDRYPFKPPTIKLLTKIWHPSFIVNRNICKKILDEDWSPAFTAHHLLTELVVKYLEDPGITACCSQNLEVKRQYEEEKESYITKAKEWTLKYARCED